MELKEAQSGTHQGQRSVESYKEKTWLMINRWRVTPFYLFSSKKSTEETTLG